MTAPQKITPPEFEVVMGSHYKMTRADFLGGLIITDPVSGREAIQGTTRLGVMRRTLLDTPLCDGCDAPIPSDGVCHGCRMIHADIAEPIEPARHVLTERALRNAA